MQIGQHEPPSACVLVLTALSPTHTTVAELFQTIVPQSGIGPASVPEYEARIKSVTVFGVVVTLTDRDLTFPMMAGAAAATRGIINPRIVNLRSARMLMITVRPWTGVKFGP